MYELARLADLISELTERVDELEEIVGYPGDHDDLDSVHARLQLLEGTEESSGSGSGSGSGGGGSETALVYLTQLKYSATDTRRADIVIEEMLDQMEARLELLILEGGRRPMQTHMDQMRHELAIVRQSTIALLPGAGERSQSANVVAIEGGGIYGDGSLSYPEHIITDLTLNTDGTIEP
jgi:hypothetical protein